jgi:outer membrane lipoprotein-sorting protein
MYNWLLILTGRFTASRRLTFLCLIIPLLLAWAFPEGLTAQGVSGNTDSTQIVQQFLGEMSGGLKNVRSITCKFTQERRMAVLTEPIVSKGVCLFAEPDQLRWEVTEPYHSIMIYSKDQIAKFDLGSGQPKKLQLGTADLMRQVLKQIISWMKGDFSASRSLYKISIRKSAGHTLITLVPRSEKLLQNIKAIEITVENRSYHVTQVVIRESASDAVTITFSGQRDNLIFDPGMFDLNQPGPLPAQ